MIENSIYLHNAATSSADDSIMVPFKVSGRSEDAITVRTVGTKGLQLTSLQIQYVDSKDSMKNRFRQGTVTVWGNTPQGIELLTLLFE